LLSIPGHGKNKLNSAYSFGGPKLLTRTVEQATGLRIDHLRGDRFRRFVNVVDAVGGVDMCIPEAMTDPKAGLNIKAGCQRLDGQNALGYVRTRATPRADLDRIEHQREFLSALMKQVLSPWTLVNPFRMVGLVRAMPGAISVDSGDHVWNLAWLALAMHQLSGGDGVTTTVSDRWPRHGERQLRGALGRRSSQAAVQCAGQGSTRPQIHPQLNARPRAERPRPRRAGRCASRRTPRGWLARPAESTA